MSMARALAFQFPGISFGVAGEGADCVLFSVDGINTAILEWNRAEPQPTEQQIADTLASQAFLDWEAENGGNPTLTARRIIREAIDTPEGKVLVALVKVMIDQGIIAATPAQVRTAIENKIAAGEVD